MTRSQDASQPGAGDICPNLGGLEVTGPIEITWAEGLAALQQIRQAANRCATYLQDIRHVLGQMTSTSGQMADALQAINAGMGAMQGDITYASDTLSRIGDCVCRGLSAQIDMADRQLQTWETTVDTADWWHSQVLPVAQIAASVYITAVTLTMSGTATEMYAQLAAATDEGPPQTITPVRVLYPINAKLWDTNTITCPRGMPVIRTNLSIRADVMDYMLAIICRTDYTPDVLRVSARIEYYREDGLRQPALMQYIY